MTKSNIFYRIMLGGLRILALYIFAAFILDQLGYASLLHLLPFLPYMGWP